MEIDITKIEFKIAEGFTPIINIDGGFATITFEPIEPKLPMSWEELGVVLGSYISEMSRVFDTLGLPTDKNKYHANTFPTREEAEASIALAQLLQLRNAYSGYHMRDRDPNELSFMVNDAYPLTFPTTETRDLFQTQFADLIKIASPLL